MAEGSTIDRGKGVAAWKQIADRISLAILSGEYDSTGMVPSEAALAEQFGVNRHTVRSALAALAEEGMLKRVQGRGTLIEKRERLVFPIGRRTRFSEGIGAQARESEMRLLSSAIEAAAPTVSKALDIAEGDDVIRLTILSLADGMPLSLSDNYFPAKGFSELPARFAELRSVTRALSSLGIVDYVRAWTEIAARLAKRDEAAALHLPPSGIVIETSGVNANSVGHPIQFLRTVFAADKVSLRVESAGLLPGEIRPEQG